MTASPAYLATAIEAVVAAGRIQMSRFGTHIQIRHKGPIDLVTEVDLATERMLRDLIASRFPGHGVLAEELGRGWERGAEPSHLWIFDPIDGTTNYAHGLPIFCSSLALSIDGRLEVGAVFDPVRDELFTAERGEGAYLNGRRLAVSASPRLIDSLLVTGFPYDVHASAREAVGLFGAFLERARAVRRLGSAALDLCYVAAGRFDGFWERRLNPWDMAAGALLVEEAGGTVTAMDGGPFDLLAGSLLASNGLVHEEMRETISGFLEGRSRNGTV
ncbi:MAG: inositol monophosphatase family protein [Vicinamibacterales bacterium]